MKLCRFNDNRLGVVRDDRLFDVSEALGLLPPLTWPAPHGDHLVRNIKRIAARIEELLPTALEVSLAHARMLSPVPNPSKIIAAPLNYSWHVAEAGLDPQIHAGTHCVSYDGYLTPIDKLGLFIKAGTSLVGPGEGIELVYPERRSDHEIELVAVIGREAKNISEESALSHVMGYCIGLDMAVRGPEDRSFRKSPDTYTVIGPLLVSADEIAAPEELDFTLQVNGQVRQGGNTRDLTVGLSRLIAIAASCYTLYPGDLVMTGTPDGVAPVKSGDDLVATFSGLGELRTKVRSGVPSSGVHGQKAHSA